MIQVTSQGLLMSKNRTRLRNALIDMEYDRQEDTGFPRDEYVRNFAYIGEHMRVYPGTQLQTGCVRCMARLSRRHGSPKNRPNIEGQINRVVFEVYGIFSRISEERP